MRLWLFDRLQDVGVQVTIDVSQRLVISTFSGEISDAEILGVRSLIRSHPDFDPNFSEILDFSAVTAASISASAVQEASQRASNFNLTATHVVIAPQDLIFGLARMAEVFAQKSRPNGVVVRSMEEARKILRLEKPGSD